MTFFYLVRHAENDMIAKGIAGRRPGLSLNPLGREHAVALAEKLAGEGITRIYSSPLERARETAEPLGRKLNLPLETCEALIEVDYGEWTGLSFEELTKSVQWKRWNEFRIGTRPPGGESILEVQERVVSQLFRLHGRAPGERLALFTHGDVIKTALAYFLGLNLDTLLRLEISPASWSILGLDDDWARVLCINRV